MAKAKRDLKELALMRLVNEAEAKVQAAALAKTAAINEAAEAHNRLNAYRFGLRWNKREGGTL